MGEILPRSRIEIMASNLGISGRSAFGISYTKGNWSHAIRGPGGILRMDRRGWATKELALLLSAS